MSLSSDLTLRLRKIVKGRDQAGLRLARTFWRIGKREEGDNPVGEDAGGDAMVVEHLLAAPCPPSASESDSDRLSTIVEETIPHLVSCSDF